MSSPRPPDAGSESASTTVKTLGESLEFDEYLLEDLGPRPYVREDQKPHEYGTTTCLEESSIEAADAPLSQQHEVYLETRQQRARNKPRLHILTDQTDIADVQASRAVEVEPGVSRYVSIYVRHSFCITLAHLLIAILCSIFAIPYVNLSQPNAGLRLRENPVADRADGFASAATRALPEGFFQGIAGSMGSVQSLTVRERVDDGDHVTILWYANDETTGNIFTESNLQVMSQFEDELSSLDSYKSVCKVDFNGVCLPIYSPLSYLLHEFNQSEPLERRVTRLFNKDPFFFAGDFLERNGTSRYTRTTFYVGLPLPGYSSPSDRRDEQDQKVFETLGKDMLVLLQARAFSSDKSDPRMTYNQNAALQAYSTAALMRDLTLAGVAIGLIFVCLMIHFGSLFLAVGALIQILISFPVSLFCYRIVLGIRLFGGMHVLGVFLTLGIGVDDCFVFFDAFDQVTRENPSRSRLFRMNHAFKAARFAMFATSFTTAICFLSLITSGIPILKFFGVFCALLVAFNYVLCMTLFAGFLLIWDEKLRRRPTSAETPAHARGASKSSDDLARRSTMDEDPASTSSRSATQHAQSFDASGNEEASAAVRAPTVRRRSSLSLSEWSFSNTKSRLKRFNATLLERAFVYVAERFITRNVGKMFIIIPSLVAIGVLTFYAAQMQPSKSIDSFWAVGNPFRVYEELTALGFYGDWTTRATMRFMNGLRAPFRTDYDYTQDTDYGIPVYDPSFDLSDPQVQVFIADQCDRVRAALVVDTALHSRDFLSYCPMNEFRDWIQAKGRPFPVTDSTEFNFRILEFVYQPYQSALATIGFAPNPKQMVDPSQPKFVPNFIFNQFPTTLSQRGDDLKQRRAAYAAWSEFAANGTKPEALGSGGSDAPVDGFYDVWMETQAILLQSSYSSIAFSLGVAVLVLLIATHGDIFSSFVGLFCLAASVSCTLGVMFLMGWSLGAVEAVSCSILCGVAIDYGIHMSIAHSETFSLFGMRARRERVVEALRKLGVSVLFGAITTFLSSVVLLFCTIGILIKFGQFMIIVIVFALGYAIFLQMAILSLPVPSRPLCRGRQLNSIASSRPHAFASSSNTRHASASLPTVNEAGPTPLSFTFKRLTRAFGSSSNSTSAQTVNGHQATPQKKTEKVCFASSRSAKSFQCTDTKCFVIYSAILALASATVLGVGLTFRPLTKVNVPPNSILTTTDGSGVQRDLSASLKDLTEGSWTEIKLPLSMLQGCAQYNEPYSFFVYKGRSDDTSVLNAIQIEFEGRANAICYDASSCNQRGAFNTAVDRDKFKQPSPVKFFENRPPKVFVYLPYCTADAHVGNRSVDYSSSDAPVDDPNNTVNAFRHAGAQNVRVAMNWLLTGLQNARNIDATTSAVIQGCGAGGLGALATSSWLAPELARRTKITRTSLIVDSATKTLRSGSMDLLAYTAWGSALSFDFANANTTLNGRMLVASSAYDWFQTKAGGFPGLNALAYKAKVESDPQVFPYLMQLNGDRHCVVLDPVGDRMMDYPKVTKVVQFFTGISQVAPMPSDRLSKCSKTPSPPCELDADLRDKTALCKLKQTMWC